MKQNKAKQSKATGDWEFQEERRRATATESTDLM